MPTNIHGSAVLSLSNSECCFEQLYFPCVRHSQGKFLGIRVWPPRSIVTSSLYRLGNRLFDQAMEQKKEKRTWWALPNKTVSFANNTYYDAYSVAQQIPNKLHLTLNCVKLIMDRWTLGIFFELFFGPIFGPFFGPFYWGGGATISALGGVRCSLSVLREGWEADCCYSGRGGRRTISTQGGMGGGYRSKCYWLMEFLLDHTNFLGGFSTEYFLCQTFWAGLLVWTFLLSCECESAT